MDRLALRFILKARETGEIVRINRTADLVLQGSEKSVTVEPTPFPPARQNVVGGTNRWGTEVDDISAGTALALGVGARQQRSGSTLRESLKPFAA